MSFLREVQLDDKFGPFVAFRESFGFIPNLYRAQSLLPRVIEALAILEGALLLREKALSRVFKEKILLSITASRQDVYCVTAHGKILSALGVPDTQIEQFLKDYRQASLPAAQVALIDFCLKLSHHPLRVHSQDIEGLRACGFDDDAIYEAVLVTALASYHCTLSAGLGPEPDFEPRKLPSATPNRPASADWVQQGLPTSGKKGPFLPTVYRSPRAFAPFLLLQKSHGYIPNFFRAQARWPDVLEAETDAVGRILMPEDVLSRLQKECVLLAVSGANLNSYCVAVHCNLLRGLGMSAEEGDQIAVDHHQASLPKADMALVDFALKVGVRPSESCREDIARLRGLGFTEEQVLEGVVVTALNNFANTLQMGLGIVPDFEPPLVFEQKKVHLSAAEVRPSDDRAVAPPPAAGVEDPDAGLVAEAQGGGLEAFEELVRHHSRCVYRCLIAILGDTEEAQDAMQDTFLSAFKHIAGFQGRAKFSTWLVSIARNTALQRLRDRKQADSLDEPAPQTEEEFRPRQVRAWGDDPEQMYSETETRQLVERAILGLPAKYRVVLTLRDIEQLSTEEVAKQLGLSVPALKARLLRGRLMLRESLSPYFAASTGRATP
ncbi:MAG TPA: peroxidase-related enzyme [Candidatus Acidoferrales bacterium]|nr:peroxidase-related enzyme [Candidatus Acidoferrales bacterium]